VAEPLIERCEVVALPFDVSDIARTLTSIEELLEEDNGEEEDDESLNAPSGRRTASARGQMRSGRASWPSGRRPSWTRRASRRESAPPPARSLSYSPFS
jgi:hypothetical protein